MSSYTKQALRAFLTKLTSKLRDSGDFTLGENYGTSQKKMEEQGRDWKQKVEFITKTPKSLALFLEVIYSRKLGFLVLISV